MIAHRDLPRHAFVALAAAALLFLTGTEGCCKDTLKKISLAGKKAVGDHVVYKYKLDVKDRAPKSRDDWFKRETIAVLDAGTRVAVLETVVDKDPLYTVSRIRAGDVEGWVDANYLVDAASYDAALNKEYVVYVSDLEVLDGIDDGSDPSDPYPKTVTTLKSGDRVVSAGACKGSLFDGYPLYRRIRAGAAEGWVFDRYLVPAAEYDAAARANKLTALGDEYIVAVEKLNLRAAPSTDAKVLATLPCRTELANLSSRLQEPGASEGGGGGSRRSGIWRQVRVGDKVGWVATEYILPSRVYDYYRRADELGQAGDAAGMLAAIKDGKRREKAARLADTPYEVHDNIIASPNGRRVFVNVEVDRPYTDEYSCEMLPSGLYGAGLAFEAGRGLVSCGFVYEGKWSPDSRYFARCRGCLSVLPNNPFTLLDVETGEETRLGSIFGGGPQGDIEFANGYIIWFDNEGVEFKGEPLEAPILVAYNVGTGEKIRLLKYDAATIRETKEYVNAVYFDVILVPADSPPPALRFSEMYKKWNGAHATATGGVR